MRQESSTPTPPRRFSIKLVGGWRQVLLLLALPQALWAQQPARPAPPSKLAPGLQGTAAPAQTVRVSVPNPAAFRQWLRQHLPAARVRPSGASAHTLTVAGLDAAALATLAASPLVDFVDVADRQAHEEKQLSNSDLSVNAISTVHARFPQLAGQGLTVSVKELAFDPNDIDFKGRIVNPGSFAGSPSEHATAMTTLIGGAGNSHPQGRGVARQVRLATSDFARLLPDDGAQLAQAGVSVQNHSYGVTIENYYGIESQEYDRQVRQYPSLLHVFSAGNVGTRASTAGTYTGLAGVANVTGQFKMSKNTLSVGATFPAGAVAANSSRGPAHDGRIKPELVAFGEGGTSESAALVSGISILLQQVHRDLRGALPPASLVKAVLLNSANDIGRPEVDFVSGFGQADALGAVRTMRDGKFFAGTVAQAAEQVFTVTVPAGQHRIKATLAWTDPEGVLNTGAALVNDLDLELVSVSTGQRWRPWVLSAAPRADSLTKPARRGLDRLNNVEQVTLAVPAPGAYELRVRGFRVPQGPQAFSLAYEVVPVGLEWVFPSRTDNVAPRSTTALRWQWNGPTTTTRLEYRPVGQQGWRVVNGTVTLSDNGFAWTVPDTTTLAQLRLVAGSREFVSDTFAIVRAPAVAVGYTCDDETLLHWPRVPGAMRYQVYQLGATALVPFTQTTDTALVLTQAQMQNRYYAVAPIVQGKTAAPATTIDFTTQGTACYFRSFLPRQVVDETIRLDVVLGSVYRLQSATLERLGPNGYEPVQTISPVTSTSFTFTDQPPTTGRYLYRVRLNNVAGKQIYSQPEAAFLLGAGTVQAFPNPVQAGESLSLVANTEAPVTVQLFDMLGRLQRELEMNGVVNQLPTNGLKPGLYLMRVFVEGQPKQLIRVMVR